MLAAFLISVIVTMKSHKLGERGIATLEAQVIAAGRDRLKTAGSIALGALFETSASALEKDQHSTLRVNRIRAEMLDGNTVTSSATIAMGRPTRTHATERTGRDRTGLQDTDGEDATGEKMQHAAGMRPAARGARSASKGATFEEPRSEANSSTVRAVASRTCPYGNHTRDQSARRRTC